MPRTRPSTDARPVPAPRLVLVLGDQLTLDSAALAAADPARDRVLMIEAPGEQDRVWCHRARSVLFLSAMRHFRDALRAAGWQVDYVALDDPGPEALIDRLAEQLRARPGSPLSVVEPGEWWLLAALQDRCAALGVPLTIHPDTHFLCERERFASWAGDARALLMETFYRRMRKRHRVLLTDEGEPVGGQWNFDADNRKPWPRSGPGAIVPPARFEPDAITREVMGTLAARFPDQPGSLASFGWPVTRDQALQALARFVEHRLPRFGDHQDAMWSTEPFGWHALLASSLNLKLLDPREVIDAAVAAHDAGAAPLSAVEGFVRQVLGWREFIRGIYWLDMPGLAQANALDHHRDLPAWFFTGDTGMACQRAAIGQTLEHGYAHHIQRLMITGNFAMLAQVEPKQACDWYLGVYVDAVEWVELPNTAGMALHAAGTRFTSKPYAAGGAYVDRMSDYCKGCRYSPSVRSGPKACPMTVLFWGFVDRHETRLLANPRTSMMARNLAKMGDEARASIRAEAARMLDGVDGL